MQLSFEKGRSDKFDGTQMVGIVERVDWTRQTPRRCEPNWMEYELKARKCRKSPPGGSDGG